MDLKQTEQYAPTTTPSPGLPPLPSVWWPPAWWVGPWPPSVPGPYFLGAIAGGDLALQGLAAKVAMRWAQQELPMIAKLPAEAQTDLLAGRLGALESDNLLTAEEVQSLLGRLNGEVDSFVRPTLRPGGPPSLYAILSAFVAPPATFISVAGGITIALASTGGMYIGSEVAGPVGGVIGAAVAAALAASTVS